MVKKNGVSHFIQSNTFFWSLASVIVVFVVANELLFQRYNFSFGRDYWEHTGVFSEWLKNLWHPGMPHVSGYEEGASARYMPYYFVLTAVGQIFSLSPVQIMSMAGIINVILLCASIQYFFKHYFQKPLAPILGLAVFFCFWGVAWYWSNVYQLKNLIYCAGYPSSFTFALCLFSLGYIVRLVRQQSISISQSLVIILLSFMMFVCHPLTGAFGIGAAGLLVLTHPNTPLNLQIKLIIALIIGFILTEFWPYYSAIDVAFGLTGKENNGWVGSAVSKTTTAAFSPLTRLSELYYSHPFYSPLGFVMSLGPALLGIPVLCWLAFKRQQLFLISGFALMMLPFFINLFVAIPLGHRFLLFAIIFLHIAIVWALLKVFDTGSHFIKKLSVIFIITSIALNVFLAVAEINGVTYKPTLTKKYRKQDEVTVTEQFEELKAIIPVNSVVMAPLKTSWALPTFLPAKTVGLFHNNPYVLDSQQRNNNVNAFFNPNTSEPERQEILKRYNVTHILVPKNDNYSESNRTTLSIITDNQFTHWYIVVL
jgi:hypothetical protein